MGGLGRRAAGVVAAGVAAAALAASPSAFAEVPVPTDNVFVIPGANFDAWAPAFLERIDPWATDGPLVPRINAGYYDCAGCTVEIVRYPRTAGPLFGPFAPTADESIATGAQTTIDDLQRAAGTSVVSGLSLGSMVADAVQRELDADPARPPSAAITVIVTGDPTRVTPLTAGLGSFFPVGLRIPVLGWTVNRPPAESGYNTVVVVGEYDGIADFPNRPWNILADLNALAGFQYGHSTASLTNPADVPATNITTTINAMGATTTTYLVPNPQLPLLMPFDRLLPAPVINAANTILTPMVNRGYARYDSDTNRMPYLQPTDGLPKLVKQGAPAPKHQLRQKHSARFSHRAASRTRARTPQTRPV